MKTLLNVVLTFVILLSSCQQHPSKTRFILGDLFTTENLPSTKFEIRGNADTVVVSKSGTKIFIPQNTFIDLHGNPYPGAVTLELKEALNPVDMVLGNMTTVSNSQVLQSGGMIYIDARHGNQPLAIDSGKSVSVSVPAAMKVDSMKIYSSTFDSTSRQFNWINPEDRMIRIVKSDTLPGFAALLNQPAMKKPQIKLPENNSDVIPPPSKPGQSENGDTILSLIFDTLSFPELSQYRNVKFKIMDGLNFNSKDSKSIWNDMQLEKTGAEGIYYITFTRLMEGGNIVKKYKVSPVFSGADYASAMKEYNKKFANYEQKKKEIEAQRIEAERQERLAWENTIRQERLAMEKAKAEYKKQQIAARYSGNNSFFVDPSVNYVFALNKLGWANIDQLYNSPAAKPVDVRTFITKEESYESIYISLLFDKEKIYLPGYQKRDHSFGFSHNDKEEMVLPVGASAVLLATAYKDGELYFVSKRITTTDKMNIKLNLLPAKEDELKSLIASSIQGVE